MSMARSRIIVVAVAAVGLSLLGSSCGEGSVADAPRPGAAGSNAPPPMPASTDRAATTTAPTTTTAPVSTSPTTSPTPTPDTVPATSINVRPGDEVSPAGVVGDPLSISIPALGVESELVATGVLPDGTIDVPASADVAGWFNGGPRPGERGPAVIMGHVDSKVTGPGVFWGLRDLELGDVVTVQTTTGAATFVVQSVQQYPKDMFPTSAVYGPVPEPALRLITCGGSFDRSIGHYRDNIVVFLTHTEPA